MDTMKDTTMQPAKDAVIKEQRDRLEAAEKERDKLKELNSALRRNSNSQVIHNARLAAENYDLRAKIEAMEQQEPVAWRYQDVRGNHRYRSYVAGFDVEYRALKPIPLYALPGAHPAPSFADAYQGAMEEVAIWKKRALEAEDLNRKFVAEINGPTYMGEPAQPAPSVPDSWLRAIDEALVIAHIGVANAEDTYEQAKAKLDNLIGFHVDVATDPAVNGGYKLMPIEPTKEIYECFSAYDGTSYSNPFGFDDFIVDYGFALEAAPEVKP